jgi:hypothetical protein
LIAIREGSYMKFPPKHGTVGRANQPSKRRVC